MSIHLGRVLTYPCFILYWDQLRAQRSVLSMGKFYLYVYFALCLNGTNNNNNNNDRLTAFDLGQPG